MTRADRQLQYRQDQRRAPLPTNEQIAARRKARFEKVEKRRKFKQKLAALAVTLTIAVSGVGLANNVQAETPKEPSQTSFQAIDYGDYTNTVLDNEQKPQTVTVEHISQTAVKSLNANESKPATSENNSRELDENEEYTKAAIDYVADYEEQYDTRSIDFGKFTPNVDHVYNYLEDTGEFTAAQIYGILGNIAQESGFNPLATNGPYSIGLFQHEATRKDDLMAQHDWQTVDGQLDFVMHEFHTTERNAYNALSSQNTIEGAAVSFCKDFERPGDPETKRRIYYAYKIYLDRINDKTNHEV